MALFRKRSSSPAPEQGDEPQSGFLGKFRRGLAKTARLLNTDVRDLFKSEGRLVDEAFLEQMLEINVKTDMGVGPATEIVDDVRTQMRGRVVQLDELVGQWKSKLRELMAQDDAPLATAESGPTVIMVCGVNGSGKTTTIAKLAHRFSAQDKKVVLGAADTFRAAAVEQLTIWAQRLGVELVRGEQGSHPATVAYKAVEKALETGADVCIVDTAGRLQTQANLMAELTKVHRTLGKLIPEAPHEVILVIDATTGQNGISQAKKFTEAVQCTGVVLAKLDGTAKGGVVVAIRRQVGLPVKFVGLGESAEDLAPFDADRFVDALFDQAQSDS